MKSLQKHTQTLEQSILNKMLHKEAELIKLGESRKFQDYTNEEKQVFAKKLVSLSYFVGIKEAPSIDTLVLLVRFLCSHFPNFTSEELENAFYKVCAGELGDIDHYQNFSPIYIGKIINAYEEKKQIAKRNYLQLLEKKKWEDLEKDRKEYFEKNALEIITTQLTEEYLNWSNTKYEGITEFKKIYLKSLLELLQSRNLFIKYKPEECQHHEYFVKYFLSLPSNLEDAKKSIENYVRSYGKNILN